eukprot:m.62306 g.62306  ORF g.62306 m.62306 type:complete len:741 (+) comp11502_c0_seq2:165-2387(+)
MMRKIIVLFLCAFTFCLASAVRNTKPNLLSPPMGWSSWYSFGASVTQSDMEATFAKLANASVMPGDGRSLVDVGYVYANLDDGYQACRSGVNGSFHDKNGHPIFNATRFPNVSNMVSNANAFGLHAGFYVNNYICAESMPYGGAGGATYMKNMKGTVSFVKDVGFDYLKIDSGSVYNDLNLWSMLLADAGIEDNVVVENCHQGGYPPNSTWCPYSLWRVTGDSMVVGWDVEAMTTAEAIANNQSSTGCWAYPDFAADPSTVSHADTLSSQFATYAVLGAPLVISFDILDDSKLLPAWDILTNEEVIAVDQTPGKPGKLLQKWSQHSSTDPIYAWTETCKTKSSGSWKYMNTTKQLIRTTQEDVHCLEGSSTSGDLVRLNTCNTNDLEQRWEFMNGRLWLADRPTVGSPRRLGSSVGILELTKCNMSDIGQHWNVSATPGDSVTCNVQNALPYRVGGCWEITGCSFAEDAEVGTNYGCKAIPHGTGGCDANGAWAFNQNSTITSVMSGACLHVDEKSKAVTVGECKGTTEQQWIVDGTQIKSKSDQNMCITNNEQAVPEGTRGDCVALTNNNGLIGPGIAIFNAESSNNCHVDTTPTHTETVVLTNKGELTVGGKCIRGEHGVPSPFGPLQLWARVLEAASHEAKPSVAVLLVNRGSTAVSNVTILLSTIPGLSLQHNQLNISYKVRDLWKRETVEMLKKGSSTLTFDLVNMSSNIFLRLDPLAKHLNLSDYHEEVEIGHT